MVKLIQTRGGKLLALAFAVLGVNAAQRVFSSDGIGRIYAAASVLFCLATLLRTFSAGIYETPDGDILVRRLWGRSRRFEPMTEPRLAFRGPKWSGYRLVVIDRFGAEFNTDLVMARPQLEPGLALAKRLTDSCTDIDHAGDL